MMQLLISFIFLKSYAMWKSQRETVLLGTYFMDNEVRVADFQKWAYFVGYEAGTRVSQLVRAWYMEVITVNWKKKKYKLTTKWAGIVRELLAGNRLLYNKKEFKLKNKPSLLQSILQWGQSVLRGDN